MSRARRARRKDGPGGDPAGVSPQLDLARKHVEAGEIRLARQRMLVERLQSSGAPVRLAAEVLEAMEEAMVQMREHRDQLERLR